MIRTGRMGVRRLCEYGLAVLAVVITAWLFVVAAERSSGHADLEKLAVSLESPADEGSDLASDEGDKEAKEEAEKENSEEDKEKAKEEDKDKAKEKDEQKAKEPNLQDQQAERITKRNLFVPFKPKTLGAKLIGVLGDEAIFAGDKHAKVDGNVNGAKVLAIGPDWVDLEWEGKTVKQWVFGARALPPTPPKMPADYEVPEEIIERVKKMPPDMQVKALDALPSEVVPQFKENLAEGVSP